MNHDSPQEKVSPEKWLWHEAREGRRNLTLAVLFSAVAGGAIIFQARLLALGCHRLVMERQNVTAVLSLAGGMILLVLLRGVLVYSGERRAAAAAATLKQSVRIRLYRRLQYLGPAGLAGEDAAPLVETVTTAVEGVEGYVARFLPQVALAGLLPPAMLLAVIPSDWRPALVLLFSAPFIPLLMILIARGTESVHRRQWERLGRLAGHLLDLVQGLPDLRLFGAVKREAAAVAEASSLYRQGTMAVLRIAFLSALALEFFATVGTAVVAVIIGFRLLGGHLTLADGLFVLLLAPEFYLPLRNLGLSHHARMQGVAAAERIVPFLTRSEGVVASGSLPVPAGPPAIRFEGVSFRYGGGRGGVVGIDLEIPPGSITALAGASGAGKTTLARLLVGLSRPETGRVTVNGLDLTALSVEEWRSRIAWVPQKPFFFMGSLRENLLLGCPSAGEAEVVAALDAAGAKEFVARLPQGLATPLGDRGAGLSGGEQRRLALARAFLRSATLVVLDEPTAGLDAENEMLVVDAVRRLATGRTVVVITHREETLRFADRVAVLADGGLQGVLSPAAFLAGAGGEG